MPFSYYKWLSRRQKAIYRRSDEIGDVPLPDGGRPFRPDAHAVKEGLERDDRVAVERAANRLVQNLLRSLEVGPLTVRVMATRPRSASSELHGLYTQAQGRTAVIQVWMRTAQHRRVVRFRTFLRTLMHEVCHHLDYTLFVLGDSFHTEGFYRRESSLVRQIAGPSKKRSRGTKQAQAEGEASRAEPAARSAAKQPRRTRREAHAPAEDGARESPGAAASAQGGRKRSGRRGKASGPAQLDLPLGK